MTEVDKEQLTAVFINGTEMVGHLSALMIAETTRLALAGETDKLKLIRQAGSSALRDLEILVNSIDASETPEIVASEPVERTEAPAIEQQELAGDSVILLEFLDQQEGQYYSVRDLFTKIPRFANLDERQRRFLSARMPSMVRQIDGYLKTKRKNSSIEILATKSGTEICYSKGSQSTKAKEAISEDESLATKYGGREGKYSELVRRALSQAKKGEWFARRDIDFGGIDASEASLSQAWVNIMSKLEADGIVIKDGRRRSTRYRYSNLVELHRGVETPKPKIEKSSRRATVIEGNRDFLAQGDRARLSVVS